MKILNQQQIKQKIKRLAIQILENNFGEEEIILAGINNNGLGFAKLLRKEIKKRTDATITLANVTLNPANPLTGEVRINISNDGLANKPIVLVDDVANTGRTMFFAFKPFLDQLVKRIEVAVLVNREHKQFPIYVDYKGISLATTIEENIEVHLSGEEHAVYIK